VKTWFQAFAFKRVNVCGYTAENVAMYKEEKRESAQVGAVHVYKLNPV
jgi:hypothetical protein